MKRCQPWKEPTCEDPRRCLRKTPDSNLQEQRVFTYQHVGLNTCMKWPWPREGLTQALSLNVRVLVISGPLLGEKPGLPISENWDLNSVVNVGKCTPFITSCKLGYREKGWEERKESGGRSQAGGCHILFLWNEQEIALVIYAAALQTLHHPASNSWKYKNRSVYFYKLSVGSDFFLLIAF